VVGATTNKRRETSVYGISPPVALDLEEAKTYEQFTQCQAIHARSLVPCQDTPRVKATYDATVVVDKGLTALMSAIRKDTPTHDDKTSTYRFEQTMPIPVSTIVLIHAAI